ncbi:MAG: M56 family metallopeptidase, partial [Clostridiales bacterium]|nr:M56 family metallopeptidase [Clostridiales bacterium]
MTWFIKELFTASFLGSLTWLALGALRPLTGRMFSQTWHYRTGILPVLFLFGAAKAADPSARLLASLIDFMRNLQKPAEAINAAGTAVTRAAQGAGAAVLDPPLLDLNLAAGGMDIIGALSDNLNLFGTYLFAVWLVGCAAFLAVKAAAYIRLRRFLLAGAVPMTGCGAAPPVYLSSGTGAPMLLGVIKPLIILPYKDYNAEELAVVLAHERLHFKRGDMAVKFALLIANSMHWFNPLAYLINRTVSDFCETACDEALARHMNRAERMSYCEIILSAAEDGAYKRRAGKHAGEHSSPLRAGISAGENLKRRLGYMIKFKRTRLPAAILSAALSAALVFGGCVTALAMEKLDILGDGNEYFAPDYTVTDQNPDWMVQMEQERQANMDETAKRLVAINRAYQESYVSDPSEITMDEAAAIAVKAFTQFYRLDFGLGSKIYVSYVYPAPISAASPEVKIPRTVDVALLDKDGNLLPYDL